MFMAIFVRKKHHPLIILPSFIDCFKGAAWWWSSWLKHVLILCQTKFLYNKIIVFDSIYFEKKSCVCVCVWSSLQESVLLSYPWLCMLCPFLSMLPYHPCSQMCCNLYIFIPVLCFLWAYCLKIIFLEKILLFQWQPDICTGHHILSMHYSACQKYHIYQNTSQPCT